MSSCYKHPTQNGSHDFTTYKISKTSGKDFMNHNGFSSIHDFNDYLDSNGIMLTKSMMKRLEDTTLCRHSKHGILYADSNEYHKRFNEMMKTIPTQKLKPMGYHSTMFEVSDNPNYTTKYITKST